MEENALSKYKNKSKYFLEGERKKEVSPEKLTREEERREKGEERREEDRRGRREMRKKREGKEENYL